MSDRFARHVPLFGEEGQRHIRRTRVTIVGDGGIGSHILQQLAFLGVKIFAVVEPDGLDDTNQNRLIGARWDDPAGTKKLNIAERLVRSIEPEPVLDLVDARSRLEEGLRARRCPGSALRGHKARDGDGRRTS